MKKWRIPVVRSTLAWDGGEGEYCVEQRIEHLPDLIAGLPAVERTLAERLFEVVVSEGTLVPPPEMAPWLEHTFGSVEAARRQRIVRVTNRWTYEGAVFNPLRSRRPGAGTVNGAHDDSEEVRRRIESTRGDDFCRPLQRTPADITGRVHGRRVVTAANVAKADGWHGVGIFDNHDPLALDAELIADMLDVTGKWAARARRADPAARHLFLLWNCLWRAGASQVHGHVQMLLSRVMPQARVALWRSAAVRYYHFTGGSYFTDLAAVHRALSLTATSADGGVDRFASLTPAKEREIVVFAATRADGHIDPAELGALSAPLSATLRTALDDFGVYAFNVAIFGPPLAADVRPDPAWRGFPMIARFVDRGDPLASTADIAAMELFGSSVVGADPFDVARGLRGG